MFKRHLEHILFESLKFMPVVLLRGARQTGKTTLAKMCRDKGNYTFISLDHLPSLLSAKEDPVGFVTRLPKPVIIDEIQRVPELFLPIKQDVDEDRTPGRFLLTGSADPLLLPQLGDSLAGRMRLLNLWPLSQGEIIGRKETFLDRLFEGNPLSVGTSLHCSQADLLDSMCKGGYPGPYLMESDKQRSAWFNDYVSLVLQKDVLDLSRIENITQLPLLLTLLASRVGGLLNAQEMARSLRMNGMTLKRYLDLLGTLFLIDLLPPWSKNLGKRLTKSPKIYLTDTGLQLFMLNVDKDRLSQDPSMYGKVVENFVVLEVLKQMSWNDHSIRMYHYRDYSDHEVDLVLEGPGGDLVAIEIKSSETVGKEDFKGLKVFQEAAGDKLIQGVVLYAGTTVLPFGDKLVAMPISSLWS